VWTGGCTSPPAPLSALIMTDLALEMDTTFAAVSFDVRHDTGTAPLLVVRSTKTLTVTNLTLADSATVEVQDGARLIVQFILLRGGVSTLRYTTNPAALTTEISVATVTAVDAGVAARLHLDNGAKLSVSTLLGVPLSGTSGVVDPQVCCYIALLAASQPRSHLPLHCTALHCTALH
jgi:hypothetical protein